MLGAILQGKMMNIYAVTGKTLSRGTMKKAWFNVIHYFNGVSYDKMELLIIVGIFIGAILWFGWMWWMIAKMRSEHLKIKPSI